MNTLMLPLLSANFTKKAMKGEIKRYVVRYMDSSKKVKRGVYAFVKQDILYFNSRNKVKIFYVR